MTKDEARTRSLMRYIGTQVGSGGTREEAEGKVSAYLDGFDAGYDAAIAEWRDMKDNDVDGKRVPCGGR